MQTAKSVAANGAAEKSETAGGFTYKASRLWVSRHSKFMRVANCVMLFCAWHQTRGYEEHYEQL